jgi:hypothetical protein
MGYEAMFFARLNLQEINRRIAEGKMEFNWRPEFEEDTGPSSY